MADNRAPIPDWMLMAMLPSMTPAEKELRDKFIAQYMLDFDAWAACIRIGHVKEVALDKATEYMTEPYVQQQIASRSYSDDLDPKAAAKRKRRQIEASLMREAHYRGPGSTHAARVAALSRLCGIHDMDEAAKAKANVTHRGGVMMVPAIASVDEWEAAASASQDKLMEDARH